MIPELWNIYLRLQSEYAYGGSIPTPSDPSQAEPWNICLEVKDSPRVLVIGPGGLGEIVACQKTFQNPEIYVLTTCLSEVTYIQNHRIDIQTVLGDIHNTNYSTAFFDVIAAWQVFEHAFSPYIALMECRRILKTTGHLLFMVPSFEGPQNGHNEAHISCLSRELWKELMYKTGFQITRESIEDTNSEAKYYSFVGKPCTPPGNHNKLLQEISQLKSRQIIQKGEDL